MYHAILMAIELLYGSVFGKRDLLAIFHVMKYDVKCNGWWGLK